MMRTEATDRICSNCWNRAVDCFGTGKIFLRRAAKYKRYLSWLSYFGIAVPAIVGAIVLTWGIGSEPLPIVLAVAGLVGIAQLAFSIASIVDAWPAKLEYAHESAAENLLLSEQFKQLAETALNPDSTLQALSAQLIVKDQARSQQDSKQSVTDKELRLAHRYGLRHFRRACSGCGKSPTDMVSTNCNICGEFK